MKNYICLNCKNILYDQTFYPYACPECERKTFHEYPHGKPAPLGEGKKDYTDADVAFANSFQRDNKHYIQRGSLGESSEEQKRVPKLVKWAKDGYPPIDLNGQYRHVVELIWHYIDMEKKSTSPTSEPPEEQEELWKEVSQWFGIETYSVSSIRELQKHFTIHRKRD